MSICWDGFILISGFLVSSGAEYLRKTLTGGLVEPVAHSSRTREPRNEMAIRKLDKKVQEDDDAYLTLIYAFLLLSSSSLYRWTPPHPFFFVLFLTLHFDPKLYKDSYFTHISVMEKKSVPKIYPYQIVLPDGAACLGHYLMYFAIRKLIMNFSTGWSYRE